MNDNQTEEEIKKLSDRIAVLEAEKAPEKFIRNLYAERSFLIHKKTEAK